MASLFIYIGFAVLLISAVFGLFIAFRGFRENGGFSKFRFAALVSNHNDSAGNSIHRLVRLWLISMVTGIALVGVGAIIGYT